MVDSPIVESDTLPHLTTPKPIAEAKSAKITTPVVTDFSSFVVGFCEFIEEVVKKFTIEDRSSTIKGHKQMFSKESHPHLVTLMNDLGLSENDLVENFIRGSGSGGQKINKTSSCVQLIHEASGIEIRNQDSRSRETNRVLAREELCRRLQEIRSNARLEKKQAREKKRRQHRRPSKAKRLKNVVNKRRHGLKKQNRKSPNE